MNKPLVAVQLVVLNGEDYIKHCLDAILGQSYDHNLIEIFVLDNGSTDQTKNIIKKAEPFFSSFRSFRLIESDTNLGMWPAQESLLKLSSAPYIISVSVDVIIDKYFIEKGVEIFESDAKIGAIQAKIYQYEKKDLMAENYRQSSIIDTCGFALTKERKVVNIGHGKIDQNQFSQIKPIFGVEGAVPFFRRSALESCRLNGWIWDPDYFWYGDDLDLAWRMTLIGHKQLYNPALIAWHDRSTTKGSTNTGLLSDYVQRRKIRQQIPIFKRRLDWSNTRFTIIKNDYFSNFKTDFIYILLRELNVQAYALLFEPAVLLEWGRFFRLLPRMVGRRKLVMEKSAISASDLRSLMLVDVREYKQMSLLEFGLRIVQIFGLIFFVLIVFFLAWVLLRLAK